MKEGGEGGGNGQGLFLCVSGGGGEGEVRGIKKSNCIQLLHIFHMYKILIPHALK